MKSTDKISPNLNPLDVASINCINNFHNRYVLYIARVCDKKELLMCNWYVYNITIDNLLF